MSESTEDPNANRSTRPISEKFAEFMTQSWLPRAVCEDKDEQFSALWTRARREKLSARFPNDVLIIPAGTPKTRSNDTEYEFRAHSDFTYLTGWASDCEAGSILVMIPEPESKSHVSLLFFHESASFESPEFYSDALRGEFWVGPRPSLSDISTQLGIETRSLTEWENFLSQQSGNILVSRDADPLIMRASDARRLADTSVSQSSIETLRSADSGLSEFLSEQRLIKDEWEINELREAVNSTHRAFDDVISSLGDAKKILRGERHVEGIFSLRARSEGNGVGYGSIAASGKNATILHWTKNDGKIRDGELILIDAGVERDSYYTADITRTFPVSGTFTPIQKKVYEAVLEAADAAIAVIKPGVPFKTIHDTAMQVIAKHLSNWGLIGVSAKQSLQPENQFHRRFMIHGTSHHLGLDVHDCASARKSAYADGDLAVGMVFTVEPGLYFQENDESVPQEFRGIGIRIEDNIVVTETACTVLSERIPRTVEEIENCLAEKNLGSVL